MTEEAERSRRGRPPGNAASAHKAIMDAVYELLRETSVRQLTMEAVAKRAGVGKPTLYKWWSSKSALVLAMFHERLAYSPSSFSAATVEEALRLRVRRLIAEFQGLFGKVMAELIAEGQSDNALLQELYDEHIGERRAYLVAEIERAQAEGEFAPEIDPILLVDEIIGPIYYRLLLRITPLDEAYGERLIDQVMTGVRRIQLAESD